MNPFKASYFFPFLFALLPLFTKSIWCSEAPYCFNPQDVSKVGLWVIRMGNIHPMKTQSLTPKTDFSITTPRHGWHGRVNKKSQNVYAESEDRLKQSFPHYPATKEGKIRYLTDHYSFEFFRSFSPEILSMLTNLFAAKGYETVNIAELSREWEKPISESTLAEVLSHLKMTIDALVVFQYIDVGNSSLRIGSLASKRVGLFDLIYSVQVFDTKTQTELFVFEKEYAVFHLLLNDPVIAKNEEFSGKIRIFDKGVGRWNTLHMVNELSDDVIVERLAEYIQNGIVVHSEKHGKMEWKGLTHFIPVKNTSHESRITGD